MRTERKICPGKSIGKDANRFMLADTRTSLRGREPLIPTDGQSSVTTQAHPAQHENEHGRALTDIRNIINKASISSSAKATAIRIFQALGEAEAEIHATPIDRIHFHEVGAVDAIIDIVCAAVGAESLAVEEWVCSPLNVGGGTVKCAHGTFRSRLRQP